MGVHKMDMLIIGFSILFLPAIWIANIISIPILGIMDFIEKRKESRNK